MSTDSTDAVRLLFDLLDQWRHFPAYQLERRADIFFALYLPGIVEHALGVKVDSRVIPEFPIRKQHSRRSTKVDYLALSDDRSAAFLIELKTEMRSRNRRQDAYLADARRRGLGGLLSDVPVERDRRGNIAARFAVMDRGSVPGIGVSYAFPEPFFQERRENRGAVSQNTLYIKALNQVCDPFSQVCQSS